MVTPKLDLDKLYTPKEAAAFLRIEPDTVKDRCRNGTIKGRRIGPKKEWRIPGTEIRRLMKDWGLEP